MKKLYKKRTVHPSPSPSPSPPPPLISDLLPAAILMLTVGLSPEDKEVLAYLVSSTGITNKFSVSDHPPLFNCSCFRCYMSYWVRWDSSPNRQLIHQIIDAFEDFQTNKDRKNKVCISDNNSNSSEEYIIIATELAQSPEADVLKVDSESSLKKLLGFFGERIRRVLT